MSQCGGSLVSFNSSGWLICGVLVPCAQESMCSGEHVGYRSMCGVGACVVWEQVLVRVYHTTVSLVQ